ncbi:MAG: methyltransferase domain-containing protein [Gemmatimonadota bacterium]
MSPEPAYELTRCPVCDTLENREITNQEEMRREVELLWAFHEKRLKPTVPVERLADRLAFSQHPPIRLSQCARCSHLYRNPWEREKTLRATYETSALSEEVLLGLFETQFASSRAQARRLTSVLGRSGRGLEVGSYVGGFLAASRDCGWRFEGVDVNEQVTDFAHRQGFAVTQGEIGGVSRNAAYDAIAIWNTFEQLYDSRETLIAARRLLTHSGILALRIPNGSFYLHWRKRLEGPASPVALRLLSHNNFLTFPYRQGFTEGSLTHLLASCGFSVVRVFGDTLVPVADEWTTGYGALEEVVVKRFQRLTRRGWDLPWVEVYARPQQG